MDIIENLLVKNIMMLSCQVMFGQNVLTDLRKSLVRVAIVFVKLLLMFFSLCCSVS